MTESEKARGPKKEEELESFLKQARIFLDNATNKKDLDKRKKLLNTLTTKYDISQKEHPTEQTIDSRLVANIQVPTEIFSHQLSALEALVKYLRENQGMSKSEIARQLNRDPTTIWTTYQRTQKKQLKEFLIKNHDNTLPLTNFSNRTLSVFEWVTLSLYQQGLRYSKIAILLNRDQRNVWSTVNRAVKKLNLKGGNHA